MSSRSHSHYQELLELHISGIPLDPEERLELFDHIETCDQCRLMLEAEERLTARMKVIPKMVAPSDLRSKILSQAIRDHTERTTTPSEDPHVADLLKVQPIPAVAAPPGNEESELPQAELPFFPAIAPPRRGRFRRAWQKASPAFATSFLVIASLGALYTGQFQGIPLANEAQQLVWAVVDSAVGKKEVAGIPTSAIASASSPIEPRTSQVPAINSALPDQVLPKAQPSAAGTSPLPGTTELARYISSVRGWLASVNSTVAVLARASKEEIPVPAEESTPQIAALVLKPTDPSKDTGGFRQSQIAQALQAVANAQPGGRLADEDQFAMNGQRYRLYTLELPAGSTNRLVQNLTPYQSVRDGVVVEALSSQKQLPSAPYDAIRFFSGNHERLKSALETMQPVAASEKNEWVQIILVE